MDPALPAIPSGFFSPRGRFQPMQPGPERSARAGPPLGKGRHGQARLSGCLQARTGRAMGRATPPAPAALRREGAGSWELSQELMTTFGFTAARRDHRATGLLISPENTPAFA